MQMDRDFVKVDLALTLQRYVGFFVISVGQQTAASLQTLLIQST